MKYHSPEDPVTINDPLCEMATDVTSLECPSKEWIMFPDFTSQIRAVLSFSNCQWTNEMKYHSPKDPVTINDPSCEMATEFTLPECLSKERIMFPDFASQIRAVLSFWNC